MIGWTTDEIRERLAANVRGVRERIARAADEAGRDADEIDLVCVTKYVDPGGIRALVELGEGRIGENRPEQLAAKRTELGEAADGAVWHLIGPCQRRKVKYAVRTADRFDALGRLEDADRFARRLREEERGPLPVLLEVNVTRLERRHGVLPEEAAELLEGLADHADVLPVRGLMAMAPEVDDPAEARSFFREVRELRDELRGGPAGDLETLSMGMTADLEAAVAEGSTEVRVGSALFEGIV